MDYGQTGQDAQGLTSSGANQDFFTSGAGTNDDNKNTFESENNLDLTNEFSSWDNASARPENQRNIGSAAIFSPESTNQAEPTNNPPDASRLGEIVDVGPLPPTMLQPQQNPSLKDHLYDEKKIKIVNGCIDPGAIKEVDRIIDGINPSSNMGEIYSELRSMVPITVRSINDKGIREKAA